VDDGDLPPNGRLFTALGSGAVTGALLTGAGYALPGLLLSEADDASTTLVIAALASIAALVVWAGGLLVVGLPVWAALCRRGVRSWPAALLAGGGLSAAAAWLVSLSLAPPLGFMTAIGAAGAVVGWVVWRVAYPSGT
jgi:hypothetical protein